MKFKNSTSSDRFFQIRNARNTEIAEDYTEMIAELINENGEARVVDLAKNFGVTSPTVNSIIRRLVRDGFVESKPYRSIFLTEKGNALAKYCKKRHDIVYKFLISIGVDIETAKMDAEGIEHHVSAETLNIFENFELNAMKHNSLEYINLLAEVMKYAYSDRSKYLGDPDFYEVPIKKITSKDYAKNILSNIKIGKATPANDIYPGKHFIKESHETTHFSVADKSGNVVSMTYTLNSTFGSKVVIKDTGILMNNEMDDFSAAPGIPNQFNLLGAEANQITPFKRPLSSMTPTIVLKDEELFFTTGSPGGSRIISAVLQSILNIIDFGMDLEEATFAKRIHHQWYPDILEFEFSLDEEINMKLQKMDYDTSIVMPLTCLQTIMFKDDIYYGYGVFRRVDALASGEIIDR